MTRFIYIYLQLHIYRVKKKKFVFTAIFQNIRDRWLFVAATKKAVEVILGIESRNIQRESHLEILTHN